MFNRMRLGRSLCVAGAMLTLGGATLGGLGATTIATAQSPTTTDEYGPIPTDGPTTTDEYGPIPTDAPTTTTTTVVTTTTLVGSEFPVPTTTTTTIAPNVASEAPNPPTLPATGSRSAGAVAILGLSLLVAGLVVSGLSRRPRSLES
jgi:LPXTG-motif cell wall-anchored protein